MKPRVVDICGVPFTVVERTPEADPAIRDCYGYVDKLGCRIVLRAGLPPACRLLTLVHEIQHAIWEHAGIQELLAGGGTDHEETFVQIYSPHLIAALRGLL